MKKTLIISASLAVALTSHGQVVLGWTFGTTSANANNTSGTPVNFTVSGFSIGNSLGTVSTPISIASASSGYTGASGQMNIGNAQTTGALNTGTSGYFQFTLTPSAGYEIQLRNLDFGMRSTSTGAQSYALRSNVDNYSTDIFTGTVANNATWSFKDNTVSTEGLDNTAVIFRLYCYGGTGIPGSGTINTRMDDVTMSVTANPVPEPSEYAAMAGAGLIGFAVWRRRAVRKA